jgi:iron complex outermembrane recepter protein
VDSNPDPLVLTRVRKAEAGTAGSMQELDLTLKERGYFANRSYDGFFPSLHLTYSITDNLQARFAYAKTFGRPDYANIIPLTTIDDNEAADINPQLSPGTITIRNTGLKPWTANNYDFSLEYYPKHGGLISVGAFQKDLSDFWTTLSGALTAETATLIGVGPQYAGWSVSSTINGGDAQIKGQEFNVVYPLTNLPNFLKYFTVKANATFLQLSGANSPDFRGFIEKSGNFNIGFNKKPYSFNVTLNFRGEQKNAPQTGGQYDIATLPTRGFYEYYAPRTFVDASGEYKITKGMSVFASVRNLFNKPQVLRRMNDASPQYSHAFRQEEFAIAMSVGIKGTF